MSWGALIGAIFQGFASRSESRREQRTNKDESDDQFYQTKYAMELADYFRRKERSQIAKGWDNWFTDDKPGRDPGTAPDIQQYLREGRRNGG